MSLFPIGAQPISFDTSPLAVKCKDSETPLLIGPEDRIIFQLGLGCCDDTEYIDNPNFQSGWVTAGRWTVGEGIASSNDGATQASIEYQPFQPDAFTSYCIAIQFDEITGDGVRVTFGGVEFIVSDSGLFTATVVAQNTNRLNIALIAAGTFVQISSAQVSASPSAIELDLIGCEDEDVLFTTTLSTGPQYFEILGNVLQVIIPMEDTDIEEGCFFVRLRYTCGEDTETLDSTTTLKVLTDCEETINLRVCNDSAQMGMAAGYFEMRIEASMVRPRWPMNLEEFRDSTGRIVRTQADSQTVWELHIERVGYLHHQFLRTLAMWDHLYLQGVEWAASGSDYNPLYSDATTFGAAIVELRPRQELMRAVRCDALGEGCDPANDPICSPLNAILGGPVYVDDEPYVRLSIFDELGFTPGDISWTIDGVGQTPVTYTGPGSYDLGPVLQGGIVTATIPNEAEPGCDFRLVFTQPCDNSLAFLFAEPDDVDANGVIFNTNSPLFAPSGWAQVRRPDGVVTDFGAGGLDVTYRPATAGPYCLWPSYIDTFQPNTEFTRLEFFGPDWLSIDLTAIAGHQLERLGFTGTPNLGTVVFAPFPASLEFLDVTGITLSEAQLNAIVIEMDALGTNNVVINCDGAGNPALTGAAIAAAAAIVSRGGTVNSN